MSPPLDDELSITPSAVQWKKVGVRHHHGINLLLFSLHSQKSCGIGEFPDLLPMISWCKKLGFDVIQLLPLNDTGLETSPYSALSAFALNPTHLGLASLPFVKKIPLYKEKLAQMQKWNLTPRVDYNAIYPLRRKFLEEWFQIAYPIISKQPEYLTFIKEHDYWLTSYALFKAIKESNEWKSWEEWPSRFKNPSKEEFDHLLNEFEESCHFHEVVQYVCFQQLREVKRAASDARVLIKGDIPILINRDSTDVWCHRNLFLLNVAAGSTPDQYAQEGQNWGFPVYNWEEMKKEDYRFWKERLRSASELYDLYRLDHVVGFFRIWAIPLGRPGKEGAFLPPEETSWIEHGKNILEMMLSASPLLPIAEDLGVVPSSVRKCLLSLGVCGTKVIRWERKWEKDGSFIPLSEYPKVSMTSVSTHDSDSLQLWWKNSPKEAKLFCEFHGWDWTSDLSQERHKQILYNSHHSNSLFHINLLNEYLALFPELTSAHLSDERINIPGKVLDTNWTYRYRPSIETMISHRPLKKAMKSILNN